MVGKKKGVVVAMLAAAGLAVIAPIGAFSEPTGNPQPDQMPTPDQIRAMLAAQGAGGGSEDASGLKPWSEVGKGYEKVVSTMDGQSYYTLWTKSRDHSMLAELPRGYENQRQFFAMTVASGETFAGLQAGDMLVYWRRLDNRLMLIAPELATRSTGDAESRASVNRLFTDRVLLDVPIVAMGPSGQPVIDMKDLLVGRASTFFGGRYQGNARLSTIKTAKAFPHNVEIGFEVPLRNGQLQVLHYSISRMRETPGFKPRVADERVGYFTTVYRDLGKFSDSEKWVRYINRWPIDKKDASLKLSPPKEPITFYIEHTVPVRYRRWVEAGIVEWNKAFEKIGIADAIRVYQQDAQTGEHMEKDPEDVRYNFVRWLSNDVGTAIGPSRVNPNTGEILDADVILTDGWIRHFWYNWKEVLPEIAMEGFSAETLAWLETRPQWDPRVRLAPPEERNMIVNERVRRGIQAFGGHAIAAAAANAENPMLGAYEYDGLVNRISQKNGLCMAARGKAFDIAVMRMYMELADAAGLFDYDDEEEELKKILESLPPELRSIVEAQIRQAGGIKAIRDKLPPDIQARLAQATEKKDEPKAEEKKDAPSRRARDEKPYDMLDGVPEWFIGPLLADLTMHEVGHTLGLRHNFKASSIYTLEQINSEEIKGKKPNVGSVMDYTPININMQDGPVQGDFGPIAIGPYDYWAIEYGYGLGDPKEVLKRVAEPELVYATDEDTGGPDPLARRYDFSKNPIDYAKSQMKLVEYQRGRLLDSFVKDGESWAKARRGYQMSLGLQTRAVNMMAAWVGGAHVNRDRKGDPNARPPIQVVPAAQQREALEFVCKNAFFDEAFGLTPDLLEKMTVDKWLDAGGMREAFSEATWPIHDRIAGIQASVLTMLMNPTTLRRVFDNEFLVPSDQDAVTLPEVLDHITGCIFGELEKAPTSSHTARNPYISSLRRNLQREAIDRFIDLTLPGAGSGEAYKAVSNLATHKLRKLADRIKEREKSPNIDPYSLAHLSEARLRIEKALDAQFVYNQGNGFGGVPFFFFGQPVEAPRDDQR